MKRTIALLSLIIVITSSYAGGSFDKNADYSEDMADHSSFTPALTSFPMASSPIQFLLGANRLSGSDHSPFTIGPADMQFLPRFNNEQGSRSYTSAEDELIRRTEELSFSNLFQARADQDTAPSLPMADSSEQTTGRNSFEDELTKMTGSLKNLAGNKQPAHKHQRLNRSDAVQHDFLTQPRTNGVLTPDQVTQMIKRQGDLQKIKAIINKKSLERNLQAQIALGKRAVNYDPSC